MEQHSRTRLLLGQDAMDRLRSAKVIVFGLGGVGGYAVEALARAGIGRLDLVDNDVISETNLNRQILATHDTIGMPKTMVAAQRIRSIDPTICINTYEVFFLPETADTFDFSQYDYVLDAIDTVTGKLELITRAKAAGVPVISCMGTGNKLDPSAFRVSDISKTSGCALARVIRKECGKRGIKDVKVVWSEELPTPTTGTPEPIPEGSSRRSLPGSVPFVPGVAGLIMAGQVIRDLSGV